MGYGLLVSVYALVLPLPPIHCCLGPEPSRRYARRRHPLRSLGDNCLASRLQSDYRTSFTSLAIARALLARRPLIQHWAGSAPLAHTFSLRATVDSIRSDSLFGRWSSAPRLRWGESKQCCIHNYVALDLARDNSSASRRKRVFDVAFGRHPCLTMYHPDGFSGKMHPTRGRTAGR